MQQLTYALDPNDRIIDLGGDWLEFARQNQAEKECAPERILGRPLWDFIAGPETHYLYLLLFQQLRSRPRVMTFPFRCDAPDRRRFLELQLLPGEGGAIRIVSRLLREEAREAVAVLKAGGARSGEIIHMCSLCKQVETGDGGWVEVEAALVARELFNADPPPQISHGVCPDCLQRFRQGLDEAPESAP